MYHFRHVVSEGTLASVTARASVYPSPALYHAQCGEDFN